MAINIVQLCPVFGKEMVKKPHWFKSVALMNRDTFLTKFIGWSTNWLLKRTSQSSINLCFKTGIKGLGIRFDSQNI